MIEVLAPVVGFEKLYEVSVQGIVRSFQRKKTIFLKEDPHVCGYRRVRLFKAGKRTNAFLHRVVAVAFLPNPDKKGVVNHKDRNKTQNSVYNLEWNTASENTRHYYTCKNDTF